MNQIFTPQNWLKIVITVVIVVLFFEVAAKEGIAMGLATVGFFMFIAWMIWYAFVVYLQPRLRRRKY